MDGAPRPPRLARRLLERALPADVRDDVGGDLLEVFRLRCAEQGPRRARLWYWREALSFAVRFGWERVRERRASRRQGHDSPPPGSRRGGVPMRARGQALEFLATRLEAAR